MITLNTGLYQQQNLTTKLVQDMSILQMSATELEEYLEELSLENPLIELCEDRTENPSARNLEYQRKKEWLESTDGQNRSYYQGDRDVQNFENSWKDRNYSEENLADFLKSQLILAGYSKKEWEIVDYLILSLDSKGYCHEDLSKIAAFHSVPEDLVEALLKDIQSADPAGVGARSLEECLLIQLERIHPGAELTKQIIQNYLQDIARNHLQNIAKKLEIPIKTVIECCEEIKSLNPKPGNGFSDSDHLRYVSPDALVINQNGHFDILINEYQYPRFQISPYYQHLEKTTNDMEAKQYLRDKIQQANKVSDSITIRTSNLLRVMQLLVKKQEDFFRFGPGHKKPLKLLDLAQELQMHESTVSRTLRSKYLQCSWGIYPLSYFLTAVASVSEETGQQQTQETIKQMIRNIIDGENKKKPLSDEAIRLLLKGKSDIDISRRTVNKYRQEMNIPDRSGRKVWG